MPGESHGKRVWKTKTGVKRGDAGIVSESRRGGAGGREAFEFGDGIARAEGTAGVSEAGGAVVEHFDSVPVAPPKARLKERIATKAGERIGSKLEDALNAPATEFLNGKPVLMSKATKKGVATALQVVLGIVTSLFGIAISIDTDTLFAMMDQINLAWASLAVVVVFAAGVVRTGRNLLKLKDVIKENGLKVSARGGTFVFYRRPKGGGDWEEFDLDKVTTD